MRAALPPGAVAIDAGAYKGGYTYWMRREVGPDGRVLAFEPQPELAEFLRRLVDAFGWRRVTVHEIALSSESGGRELSAPGAAPSPQASLSHTHTHPETRTYTVSTARLDDLVGDDLELRPVSFLKCDVEGHELDLFRGAERILREDRPRLLFECEQRHLGRRPIGEVFDHLLARGYRGSFFWRGALVDVGRFDPETHQVEGRAPYANNFAFEPAQ